MSEYIHVERMGEVSYSYRNLVVRRPLGKYRSSSDDNIKTVLQEIRVSRCGPDLTGL
jgi:hypothetical protein